MKQWQNKWEEFIGRRLRSEETQPQPHLWNLIEHDLDAEVHARRARLAKRGVAAAILLLIATATFVFTSVPSGDLAVVFSLERNTPLANTSLWAFSTDAAADESGLQGNIAEPYTTPALQRSVARVEDISTTLIAEAVAETAASPQTIRDMAEPVNRQPLEIVRVLAQDELIALPVSAPTDQFHDNSNTIRRSGSELVAIQAGNAAVESPLLVSRSLQTVSVQQQLGKITQLQARLLSGSARGGENELRYPSAMLTRMEQMAIASVSAAGPAGPGEDEITEELAMAAEVAVAEREMAEKEVAARTWMSDAMTELESWKEVAEAALAEKSQDPALIEEAVIDQEDPLSRRQKEEQKLYRSLNIDKGFHIGLIAGAQHTWMTKASRNSEVDRDLASIRFSPGYQVGVNFGYDITEHFGLMAEIKYSDEGTKYVNPEKNRYEQMDLRYLEVPVYAKMKHSKLTEKMRPLVFNYLIGVKYSDLRKVTATVNGREQRFGQDYNTSEWGFTAGFDFDFYINRNFFWTNGIRAGVSGASDSFPRLLNKDGSGTMTFDVGLYTRISFRLPGK